MPTRTTTEEGNVKGNRRWMTCGSQLLLLSADVGGGLERGRFPRKMRRFTAALTLLTYQRYTEFHLQSLDQTQQQRCT
ncbi:hypothetical protein OUZ56_002950 [Daphnia magna]|uniref:Uncharacterized protein n=1 Tax=Daphnia magna TaxID=35525 RepID=A0ABR0A7C5_9CRUS|nr:hypothetical protein OUZ56_002950 [Daphnia magna]